MELIHPSSIGKIMTDAVSIDKSLLNVADFERMKMLISPDEAKELISSKKKTPSDHELLQPLWDHTLSAGAKTYLEDLAGEKSYSYRAELDLKSFNKGLMCEQAGIDLINQVYFTRYAKHSGRIETDLLSGECDIYVAGERVRDVKNAWSLDTFPKLIHRAHSTLYEFQGRAYMHLYDVPEFNLDWVLVDTPEELIKWEDIKLHEVSHIDALLRVTTVTYKRDFDIERKMLLRCREAQLYIERMKKQILIDHNYEYES